ncbi:serine/threonine-protein kinase TBK1-like [Pocillopora damicornis]|uniref:serine/threonine-protein kinase TBK1-like n=1 Tax=Pocillopora damicornis TaxID=46731 RepID=UPI000F54F6A3|nr:serine/threonine-protein kinase TBK1-like [Pocillopora damicornis]
MEIRSSTNYAWNTKDRLGEGATGAVYKARHKKTGETFAVKVSNNLGMMRPVEIRRREFEVLTKLNHENIVKLYASETELRSQNEIIVMELCSGGSLFTLLENPANAYGFMEDEFKQVLKDVVAGMKHLHEQGMVHRDLKPGNIMRVIKDDGSFVYKLTDFGAARELEAHEVFMSVYGTEEYLHPDLYERGVLRKHANKTFGAMVDLWSIGVTFYHIATGQLPFRPYGGRQNKDTMHVITSKKRSGMISGVQKSEGEDIEWSDKLPDHTRLSQGLKELLTPVLAGILESDPANAMSFGKFFVSIQDILSRKVIDVYSVHSASFHKIYMKQSDTFAKFQELIAVQTGVSAAQQKLFFKYDEFKPDPMAPSSSYPKTSDDIFMVMTGGEYMSPERLSLYKITNLLKLPTESTLEVDSSTSKMMANRAQCCKYAVKQYFRATKAMLVTIESVLKNLKKDMMFYVSFCKQMESEWTALQQISEAYYTSQMHHAWVFDALLSKLTEPKDEVKVILEEVQDIQKWSESKKESEGELNKAYQRNDRMKTLISEVIETDRFRAFLEDFTKDTDDQSFFNLVSTYTGNIEEIYQSFRKDKYHRRLSYADEQRHKFDREKLVVMSDKITKITEEAVKHRSALHEKLVGWLNEVNHCYEEAESLHSSFLGQKQAQDAFLISLRSVQEQCLEKSKRIVEKLQKLITSPSPVLTATAPAAAAQNGYADPDMNSITVNQLGNELDSLSMITKEAVQTAQQNTQQIERVVRGFITLYTSLNEHMSKDVSQLEETIGEENMN